MIPETPVEEAILENGIGLFAICVEFENCLDYWIAGLYQGGDVPNGLDLFSFPESRWAIFCTKGPVPEALQELNTYVWQDWFPNKGIMLQASDIATLEMYPPGDSESPDYLSGIWVPLNT